MEQSCIQANTASKKLFIQTFGCQMNEYDSLRVQRMLARDGYETTTEIESADVIFLNTCSVREKAEQKVHSFLGRLKPLKTRQPKLKIIVAGCVAQQLGEELLSRFHHLDLVLGTRAIGSLPGLLKSIQAGGKRLVHLPDADEEGWGDLFHQPATRQPGVTAPVTVMQGCDNFCTYCIVPYVRGRERSRPSRDILREIDMLAESGVREVLLLGQNVNSYGRGLTESITFAQLLREIESRTDTPRMRFTTSHPKDLTADLVRCFAELDRLCHHIHLPFQAGSDRVLKRMNRRYGRQDYLEKVQLLREACPQIAISADVMVGFPGETDEDYRQTLQLIEEVRFDSLFSFMYSDRPFTKAATFNDKVSPEESSRRLTKLQAIQNRITLEKNRAEIGKVRKILVEGTSKASGGQLTGRTIHNRIVNFDGPSQLIGRIIPIKITNSYTHSLKGERIPTMTATG